MQDNVSKETDAIPRWRVQTITLFFKAYFMMPHTDKSLEKMYTLDV